MTIPPEILESGKGYLSGKMTGNNGFRKKFLRAATYLREQGCVIINPAELEDTDEALRRIETIGYDGFWAECLARDLRAILCSGVSYLVLMDNWAESSGAQIEAACACLLELPIYIITEDLTVIPYDIDLWFERPILDVGC